MNSTNYSDVKQGKVILLYINLCCHWDAPWIIFLGGARATVDSVCCTHQWATLLAVYAGALRSAKFEKTSQA